MKTASLFDQAKTIQEAFEAWVERNRSVYARFVEMAREAKRRGKKRWSTKAMIEVYRWEQGGPIDDVEGFKFPNNYSSRLARRIMDENQDLEGFFELARLKAS